ncbi:MAG: tRNA uridine-5-carboxymethylaminomethyl(34) synthesis GTPase MnmE [Pseudomonadota bacterium]|nr:tRNA uridine-5-carboxymethylaminomethyl(34) synthesis GTPase MnmE [Pseudomonadota bacterium]
MTYGLANGPTMIAAVDQDLICAIATPPGQGGIGVVRISGIGAKKVAETLCAKPLKPRKAVYCEFTHQNERLDDGIALWFPQPHSFTGEEVVELQGHGGPVVQQRLLTALCAAGARIARPGEFSERAFHNGKLDLAQAEGIADLIASTSVAAARAALNTLKGTFSARVNEIKDNLVSLRVQLEAAIDFPDEDIEILEQAGVVEKLRSLAEQLQQTLATADQGRLLNNGIQVALIGSPNVGKSSLLNALVGEDAAIVTDIPGTTRDLLKIDLLINGLPIRLVDTAGIRSGVDKVEQQGVARARAQMTEVDLVLLVVAAPDLQISQTENLVAEVQNQALAQNLEPPKILIVANKVDLVDQSVHIPAHANVAVSALTGQGLDDLRAAIQKQVGFGQDNAEFTARTRHVEALKIAAMQISRAQQGIEQGLATELVAEELTHAQHHLGSITGELTADELLGKIFSEFCIGK